MRVQARTTLKTYFETGDVPTQTQFGHLIDSLGLQEVATYAELRASAERVLWVTDPVYGGLFAYSTDQVSSQNGGTRIKRTDNVFMDRYWDGKNINADWFVVGEVSWIDGSAYNAATGNGVMDTADQFTAAAYVGGDGCVVTGSQAEYEFRRTAQVATSRNVQFENFKVKRADETKTTLTATAANGTTTLTVADGSAFKVGETVVVITSGVTDYGYHSTAATITAISGGTITLGSGLVKGVSAPNPYPIGSDVIRVNTLFLVGNGVVDVGKPVFRSVEVDGNKAATSMEMWEINWSIFLNATYVTSSVFENCHFANCPAENVTGGNGVEMRSCTFDDLNGSFYHFSDATAVGARPVVSTFTGIFGDGVSQSTKTGHNEGFITHSTRPYNIHIDHCDIRNGQQLTNWSNAALISHYQKITNSKFENFDLIFNMSVAGVTATVPGFQIDNCIFRNCGALRVQGQNVAQGYGMEGIRIRNSSFLNTRMVFANVVDVELSHLRLRFDGVTPFTASALGTVSATAYDCGAISFNAFDRVRLSEIDIEAPDSSELIYCYHGVKLYLIGSARRKNAAGTELDVLYPQAVRVENVRVSGFGRGFYCQSTSLGTQYAYPVEDWTFNNITVVSPKEAGLPSAFGCGIEIPPGCVARGMHLRIQSDLVNGNYYTITAQGIGEASTVKTTARGAILDGYTIFGPAAHYQIIIGFNTTTNAWNVLVRGGVVTCTGSAIGVDAAKNVYETPVILKSTDDMPGMTGTYSGAIIGGQYENAGQY